MKKVVINCGNASNALRKHYLATDKCLGQGAFGQVFQFKGREDPSKNFAVKILLKEMIPANHLSGIREEISILAQLDHPNIIKYIESYED